MISAPGRGGRRGERGGARISPRIAPNCAPAPRRTVGDDSHRRREDGAGEGGEEARGQRLQLGELEVELRLQPAEQLRPLALRRLAVAGDRLLERGERQRDRERERHHHRDGEEQREEDARPPRQPRLHVAQHQLRVGRRVQQARPLRSRRRLALLGRRPPPAAARRDRVRERPHEVDEEERDDEGHQDALEVDEQEADERQRREDGKAVRPLGERQRHVVVAQRQFRRARRRRRGLRIALFSS